MEDAMVKKLYVFVSIVIILGTTLGLSAGAVYNRYHTNYVELTTDGGQQLELIQKFTDIQFLIQSWQEFHQSGQGGLVFRISGNSWEDGEILVANSIQTGASGQEGYWLLEVQTSNQDIYYRTLSLKLPCQLWNGVQTLEEQNELNRLTGRDFEDREIQGKEWELIYHNYPITAAQYQKIRVIAPSLQSNTRNPVDNTVVGRVMKEVDEGIRIFTEVVVICFIVVAMRTVLN